MERLSFMYATVGIFSMDPAFTAQQQRELNDRIIPVVRRQPEFVSGYWNHDRARSKSYAYLVWQTEAAAHGFTEAVRAGSAAASACGVRLDSIAVVEVVAWTEAA